MAFALQVALSFSLGIDTNQNDLRGKRGMDFCFDLPNGSLGSDADFAISPVTSRAATYLSARASLSRARFSMSRSHSGTEAAESLVQE